MFIHKLLLTLLSSLQNSNEWMMWLKWKFERIISYFGVRWTEMFVHVVIWTMSVWQLITLAKRLLGFFFKNFINSYADYGILSILRIRLKLLYCCQQCGPQVIFCLCQNIVHVTSITITIRSLTSTCLLQ